MGGTYLVTEKIGVLCGGWSAERDVSLRTGEAIYQALLANGYHAEKLDVNRNIAEVLQRAQIDRAFLALHGPYGEDGTIQGLLEIMGIPYTGCGVLTSALAMSKIMTKRLLVLEGLPTANFTVTSKQEIKQLGLDQVAKKILNQVPLPMVVKANTQGSTIGISFVFKAEELSDALNDSLKYDQDILIEEFIEGKEITASVIGNTDPIVLPLIEIVSETGVYDYAAKYTVGQSHHIIPPSIDEPTQNKLRELAIATYKLLGCSGLSRVDFLVDAKNTPYILEVNTIPGMTETSLFPDAAKAAGIEFPELVSKLLDYSKEKDA